jgi:multicomponent Na+:H+ antiporter subunit D
VLTFLSTYAALWPVLIPIVGAGLTACLFTHRTAQRIAAYASVATLLIASLALPLIVGGGGIQTLRFGDWDAPFGIVFVADGLGSAMVAITGILAAAVMVFGLADIRRREEAAGFHPLFQGMLMGVNGAFLTGDLFNLYVWFEVMLITAMGLLVVGRSRARIDGTIRYAVLNLISTLLFLAGVALLYGVAGTLNMADLARVLPQTEPSIALTISAMLLLCGFGIKAGYFPLFFWLPASYHTASITVSAIFAGLLTKVGVYACFRVFTLIFTVEGSGIREIVAVLAAGTMLFGVFGAAVQWDVRRILSFHIVSQIGYMLLGLALSTPAAMTGAIFYIIHHIIVKANLFLIAGAIRRASGTFDLRKSGGLMYRSPLLAALFLVPALSLAGLPPLSGFWAKFLVIDASLRAGSMWLAGIALFVGVLTLFSMSKIWMEAFWKEPVLKRSAARPVPAPMLAAIAVLSAITLAIGFMPEPLVNFASAASESLLDTNRYIAAVLGQPAAVGELP